MNFQQLETFQWVARLRSFSRAAHRVNASQSTVSMRMTELERELGIKVLDRDRRNVRLTPKGRELLRYAEEVVLRVSAIRQLVGDSGTLSGTLRIGAAELVALTWLPKLIKVIKSRYPLVDVELQVGLGGAMLALLREGELDLVLMPTDEHSLVGMRAELLGNVRFGFVASKVLGVPDRPQTPEGLMRWPLITHGPASVLHGVLDRWFESGGARLSRIVTSSSMEAAAMLAGASLGVTFLPLDYYEPKITNGQLMHVRSKPAIPPVSFNAVFPKGPVQPLVEAIARLAAENSTFGRRA